MDARLAEEQIFNRKKMPLIYLVKKQEYTGVEKVIQSRSGLFYVMVIIVVFFSLGLLLNIGLKIQSLNLERKIIDINEMITIEKDRTDRIQLKISELKSPSRIIRVATDEMGMQISDKINVMRLQKSISAANLKKNNPAGADGVSTSYSDADNSIVNGPYQEIETYDSFLGTIDSIKDIVMVVSEGVLTFFIP